MTPGLPVGQPCKQVFSQLLELLKCGNVFANLQHNRKPLWAAMKGQQRSIRNGRKTNTAANKFSCSKQFQF
jgi:hypothetical protein